MLIFIGLLILAVLLFGSSAVIGAFGWILGSVAAIFALGYLSFALSVDPVVIVLIILAIIGIGGGWATWHEKQNPHLYPKDDD